jgi:CO/xanthine dehydrogenase Mo-binding subunit
MAQIEAVRVAQDAAYAASLSDSDWYALSQDPAWQEMVAEQSEMVAGVLAKYADKIPGANGSSTPAEIPANHVFKILGSDIARIQGYGIVTNQGTYTENLRMPGMLYMRTLRSRHPHAKIRSVDTGEAEKIAGVRKILHRGNLPEEYKEVFLGSALPTRYIFSEEVFEVGAPIAVIAADSEHIADEAIRAIKVEYEVLPAALDMLEAMKSSTSKQFESKLDGTTIAVARPLVRGDPTKTTADAVVDVVATKSTEQHLALELTNSLSFWDGDKLNMTYTNQHAHGTRSGLASALKLPQNKVRVFQTGYLGSGYGYRSGIDLSEIHAALLSKLTGRPIKNMYTRYEDFVTRTHRPAFRNEMKLGVNRDGKLQFGIFKVIANVGAQRAGAADGAWYHFQHTYTIPNLRLEGVDVMTNSYKSGPYRCVSHPNGTFALETTMDKAAYAINMDPVELRLKNINVTGNQDTKRPFSNAGLKEVIEGVRDAINWKANWHAPKAKQVRPGVYHGIGFAAHVCSHGAGGNPSTGQVIINSDGSVQAVSGVTDIGSGQRTNMMMIAAEALGVPLDRITITPYIDTENTTDSGGTNGSRMTNTGGRGMYEAGRDARNQVHDWGARAFVSRARAENPPRTISVTKDDVELIDGTLFLKSDKNAKLTLAQVVQFKATAIIGKSDYVHGNEFERAAFAAGAAEVEVDTLTGSVKVTRFVAGHDVGKAFNPFSIRQQVEGGVVMAMGAVFTEELLIDKATGLPLNPNMLDYRPQSIKDAVLAETVLIEKPKEYGTFGGHGMGEPPMGPPAPAVVNAVYNAVGVWVMDMPLTREKLLAALKASN